MIALRYTRSSAADRLVSFMSFIAVAGLVLGVAVLVLVLSVMNGFEQALRDSVLAVLPHGVIFAEQGFADCVVEHWEPLDVEDPFLLVGGKFLGCSQITTGVSSP